ncbi:MULTISPECIES: hydantoinase B/oxoprolinase family protein [Agrobacterium]|uniref:Hydantoinase B/oxoprolinase family protein n=1 Tax=Agrobacterium rubi TaxID=28099 RepID=A0AAE7R7T3_9HYPH|nr:MULTISPECIES: hydantoinase B/oxoprolinase family protein [Agrobacterium]MBN7809216.1 hydantoinase B/oxoprolinase family protein [Agrobacterium rosae]NTE89842.1 hydantoinase B/oxoprolinase family protein [Agrobacterium rubi]NTF05308.1 hydantoinase B/oxoprolinase family protein [Agrobacterium rubi]NTF39752.1 hydantoinase B/oxoprolinase family protein [Agrobacterium rubi]OCJ44932.1 methylhydantoinase [Agrobacterium rubi]
MTKHVDPITLQVIGGALHSIALQMGNVLYRMSYSSIIRESQDLGAGLFDINYNTLAESDSAPMHIGSIPGYLRGIEHTIPLSAWKPGDLIIHNHPYFGASHSPDIAVVAPVFYKGELVGFSANTAHHVDIGAATPGLIIDVPDVFAEGMLLNARKLYSEGVRNDELWNYIQGNTRVPSLVLGDLSAQIASVELGVRRFIELLDNYDKDIVFQATKQLMDYSEMMLRREIAKIPDGEYTAEGFLDDDGRNRGVRLPVKVAVRVNGDSVEVDLTGSSKQVPTAYNVPFEGSTKVACYFAFRALLLDEATTADHVPANEGSFRPVKVIAPEGSIFNPIMPASAEARFTQIQRVVDLIIKALAPVVPDRCTAGNAATLSFAAYSGVRPSGDYWVFLEVNEGAMGGRPNSDGPDTIEELMRNTRNNPLEDLGMNLPLICDRYEIRDDVLPGAGKYRGGMGVIKSQRFRTPGMITHEADRHEDTPWGIFGGHEGHVGRVEIYNVNDPQNIKQQYAKFSGLTVDEGDVMSYISPCGGGFGNPLEREPAKVLDDLLDGFINVEHAKETYGVIFDPSDNGYGWALNEEATASLRKTLQ